MQDHRFSMKHLNNQSNLNANIVLPAAVAGPELAFSETDSE
jgi:hypothetical protein